jgi:homoserine dehydrogenase
MLTLDSRTRPKLDFEPRSNSPQLRTIRVAMAGCGVVGGAFVRLLEKSASAIAEQHGIRFEIGRVLVRDTQRNRGLSLDAGLFTDDVGLFLRSEADIVIEAIGGLDPATRIAESALSRGSALISANKELIATHGAKLDSFARSRGTRLDFDAAVGGGAPLVRTLRDALGGHRPSSIRGILNGTSNFVLTALERGNSFEDAISAARKRGLAEEDYSRDLDGRDAAAKIAILAWLAFGVDPALVPVERISLLPDPSRLVRHADLHGVKVRYLAECVQLSTGEIAATVQPAVFAPENGFSRTLDEENRVEFGMDWGAPLCVSGPGAGGDPTATAILSDLLAVSRGAGPVAASRRRPLTAIPDPRSHRWLVIARCHAGLLEDVVGAHAVSVAKDLCDVSAITGQISRLELNEILDTLTSRGADPIVARVELPELEGAIQ